MKRLEIRLACAALFIAAGCGSGGSDAPPQPKTFDASGTIQLPAGAAKIIDERCVGGEGYEDISGGSPVSITDAKGTKIGLGSLEQGEPGQDSTCTYHFTVKGVPSGKGPYSAKIFQRVETTFSESDATAIVLTVD